MEFASRFGARPPLLGLQATEDYLHVEETAANAYMLRALERKENKCTMRAVEEFVGNQPQGYRQGLSAMADEVFAETVAETLRSYFGLWAIEHGLDLGNPILEFLNIVPAHDPSRMAECPVYLIDDLDRVGMVPGSITLVHSIPEIVETGKFLKQLNKQTREIQHDWIRVKASIKDRVPAPPRFEKLKGWVPPTWSIRLRSGYRVHLVPPETGQSAWQATEIGDHKGMGHG